MSLLVGKYIDANIYRKNSSSGDGSTTVFNLADTPIGSGNLAVYINGIKQKLTTDYSLSGSQVTFVEAPALAQEIEFEYIRR